MGFGSSFKKITGISPSSAALGHLTGTGLLGGAVVEKAKQASASADQAGIVPGIQADPAKGFTSGGLSAKYNADTGQFDITRSEGLSGLLNTLQARSQQLGQDFGGLLQKVRPGVGELVKSGLGELENRRRQAIGNLRDNLARRRVLGSSFAQDAIARTEAQFAQEASQIASQGAMTELQLTSDLLTKQAEADLNGISQVLSQLNIEASLGASLSGAATQAIQQALQFQQNLAFQAAQNQAARDAAELQGIGSLFGTLGGALIGAK